MLARALKTTAIAALLGLGVAGAATTSASAYTIKTRCTGDDCVRLQCNDWGGDCARIGYYERYDYDRSVPYGYERTYQTYPDYNTYPDYTAPDYDYDYYHDYDDPY